jgi:hypothetical protein
LACLVHGRFRRGGGFATDALMPVYMQNYGRDIAAILLRLREGFRPALGLGARAYLRARAWSWPRVGGLHLGFARKVPAASPCEWGPLLCHSPGARLDL